MIINLNNEDFNELIKDNTVVVDFYANWCGPCKMLGPVLEEIAKEKNIKLIKVDVDKHDTLARNYGVMSIPYVLIFKNGEISNKFIGYMPKNSILKELEK